MIENQLAGGALLRQNSQIACRTQTGVQLQPRFIDIARGEWSGECSRKGRRKGELEGGRDDDEKAAAGRATWKLEM